MSDKEKPNNNSNTERNDRPGSNQPKERPVGGSGDVMGWQESTRVQIEKAEQTGNSKGSGDSAKPPKGK